MPGNGPGVFAHVSAGGDHTCALKTDGSVVCWGLNTGGQVSPVPGNGPGAFNQVSAGEWHSCALKTDGSVVCWGSNTYGQVAPVPGNGPGVFTQVSAGGGFTYTSHSCGLKSGGSVVCWGSNNYHQVSPVPGNGPGIFAQISAGGEHTCGLKINGKVICWGKNTSGQCNLRPVAVAGPDHNVFASAQVTLDGRGSSDPDGMLPLTYGWRQTGGPVVSFSPALSLTTFIAPSATTILTFTLTVTDVPGLPSTPDPIVIHVKWPDLQIAQGVRPVLVLPGQPVTYTLAFSNSGTDDAIGVVITNVIPAARVTSLGYVGSGAAITDTGHVPPYAWQVQNLAPGEGGVITITGIISPDIQSMRSFSNTAFITSTFPDLTNKNNLSEVGFTVLVTDKPPALVNNTGMTVAAGVPAAISRAMLLVTDTESSPASITYTLQTLTAHGVLRLGGAPLAAGDAFSQQDIDLGRMSYTQDGSSVDSDAFAFRVSDGHDPTERVSVSSSGAQSREGAYAGISISADGRYVAFMSDGLVGGDTNNNGDIYVHDRLTRQTSLVSVNSQGIQGNGFSDNPAISADGRFVAFASDSTNLVAGDTNGRQDIFVHDRQTGQTWRASVSSNGAQGNNDSGVLMLSAFSATGRYVAFQSMASNLVDNDRNGSSDTFVHDNLTGQTTRASVSSTGMDGDTGAWELAISTDGRYVAFCSFDSHMVPGDTNNYPDIFVHDQVTGETTRISVSSSRTQGNEESREPSISMDGRYVAFASDASNLVSGDTNHESDIFMHDRLTGQTERVSLSSNGAQSNGDSYWPAISPDGRYIAFISYASNLVDGDTNNYCDVDNDGVYDDSCSDAFLRDRLTGQTFLISISSDGVQGNYGVNTIVLSADGRYAGFTTWSSNLVPGDTNNQPDAFVRDRGFITATFSISVTFPDLAITQSVTPDVAAPGQPVTYTLAFSNTGESLAAGVVITDIIPGQLSGVTYQASPGLVITDSGHTPSYIWQVQDLAPDEGGVITVTAIISPGMAHTVNFVNTATIGSNAADTNPADNTSSATVKVGFPLADSPWPRFRRDMTQTGRSPYVGPSHPLVKWTYMTGNYVTASPAIGMDGTIYFGSVDQELYAVNPDGSLKWKYNTGSLIFSAPAIAADGTVYFGSSGHFLFALNPDGSLKWNFRADNSIFSAPTIDADGVIYFVTYNSLYAINPDGTQRWRFPGVGSSGSPAIAPDGTIYIGADKLYAIRLDGSLKWAYTTGGDVYDSSPAIGADGTIYIGSVDQNLYALDPNGNLKWAYPTGKHIGLSSPAIGPEGTIYIGAYVDYPYGYIYALNPDGSQKWSSYLGEGKPSSPAVGGDGVVYISCDGLYAFNPDGSPKWFILAGGNAFGSSPAIGADGTIYAGGWDNKLYAIGGVTDVQIEKSVSPALAAPGDPVTYTLAFSYTGDVPATGVVITDIIPSQLSAISYQASPGLVITDTGHTPSYVWQVQDLAPGEGGVITVTGVLITGLRGGLLITNTAIITSSAAETDTMNNLSSVTLTVIQMPPVLGFIPAVTVDELSTLIITATATDLNGDGLTFSLSNGSAGASMTPEGVFTWTPTEDQGPGVYSATVQVVDDGAPLYSDSQTFTITVNEVNIAPVLDPIGDQNVNELATLVLTATASDFDLPANTLTFSLDAGAPAGAAIDPSSGVFTWTPSEAQGSEDYPVTVRVTDNGAPSLSDSEAINIHVAEVNTAPVLDPIGDQNVNELITLVFTATASDSDLPANTLTFSLDAGAPGGAAIDPSSGVFTWLPSEGQGPGVYPVTVWVVDDGAPPLSDSQTFTITVDEVNLAPVVTVGPNATLDEGRTFTRNGSFTDPDNGQTWSASVYYGDGSGLQPLTLNLDQTFTLDHRYGDDGIYTVTVSVSDGFARGQASLQVTVLNVAPTLGVLPDQTVSAGQPVTVTGLFTDPGWLDTHTVEIVWAAGVTETLELAAGETTFQLEHVYSSPGEYVVIVRLSDDDGDGSSQTFTIRVQPIYRRVYLAWVMK